MVDTPRHGKTGRQRTAQFTLRAVYIQEGERDRHGKKVTLWDRT
jgi:hypothetical protein